MKLFELYADLKLDASGFERGVNKASGMGKSFSASLRSGIGGAADYVGKQINATTVMIGNLMADAAKAAASAGKQMVSTGVEYNSQMEKYQTNFKTMLNGSAEAAAALTGELETMAAKTPFAMTDLADATQTLLQFGQDSETVVDTLKSLGDISMGDSQKLQSLTLAFAQASSSGKLMGQDLLQMINAGFNPLLTISEQTGAAMGDLKAFMSDGKASNALRRQMRAAQKEVSLLGDEASAGAKMLVQMSKEGAISADLLGQVFALETAPGGRFYGAMEAASKTFDGLVSTLQDDSTRLLGKVFRPLSDWMKDDLLPKGIDLIGVMEKAFDSEGLAGAVKAGADLISGYFAEWGPLALDAGANLLANVLTGITGDTVSADAIKEELGKVWTSATTLVNDFVSAGGGVLSGILQGLSGDETSEADILSKATGWISSSSATLNEFTSAAGGLLGTIYEEITGQEATAENIGKTIGGVFAAGGTAAADLLTTASTFFTDLDRELGNPDASIGEKIGGVFKAGSIAMISLLNDAGSFMTRLYSAISGDTEGAANIQKWIDRLFATPEQVEARNAEAGARTAFDSITELRNQAQTMYASPAEYGITEAQADEWITVLAQGMTHEKFQSTVENVLEAWEHKNTVGRNSGSGDAQAAFKADERTSREASDALSSLQQAVTLLTETAASLPEAAAAAVTGAKVVLDGAEVGEIILPIVAAGLAREIAPSRYIGGER